MFVDSHCHLDFPDFAADRPGVLAAMATAKVTHALCVGVNLADWPAVHALATAHPNLYATVGVHPDATGVAEPTVGDLVARAAMPKVVAIGETGLDYYRLGGDLEWQRERFRIHIRAAREARRPLVVHMRSAAADTLAILRSEKAAEVGGVMHCFSETWDVAAAALDLGFHISLSGIVTFSSARELHDVARRVPLDRLLIETDAPYLAPVPHRGRRNQPAWVADVAAGVAALRGVAVATVAAVSTENFFRLFNLSPEFENHAESPPSH
jgi:TatD DNase family protein